MTVTFDTGSSAVYLITEACKSTSCDSARFKKYASSESSYFMSDEGDGDRSELQYGAGFISGKVAGDRFCLSKPPDMERCQTNVQFLAAD